MEEKDTVVVKNDEIVTDAPTDEVIDSSDVAQDAPQEDKPKKKSLKTLIEYIKTHEDLRQAVMFFLFSILCSVAQIATTYIVQILVDLSGKPGFGIIELYEGHYLFDWTKSLGTFVGFLVGAVVGQVLTFILNRKKTFKATNNVVISAIMYTIMAIVIIFIQTLWSAVNMPILDAVEAAGLPTSDDGTFVGVVFGFVCTIPGLLTGGLSALVLSFFGSKYLVMRDWSKKKGATTEETTENTVSAVEDTPTGEVVVADEKDTEVTQAPADEIAE